MEVTNQFPPLPALLDSIFIIASAAVVLHDGGGAVGLPPLSRHSSLGHCHHAVPWKVHGLSLSLSFPSPHSPSITLITTAQVGGRGDGTETSTVAMVLCVMSPVTLWGGKGKGEEGWS